jgi:putative ABC transport system permease protein
MEIIELTKESLGTLTLNKLRTGLAILGIVIGIGSVIALVSLGQATQKSIQNQIQALGSNLLTVNPGSQVTGGIKGAAGGGTTLTISDAEAIKSSPLVTTISNVSAEVSTRSQITAGRNNSNIQIIGVTSSYANVHNVEISTGSFITDQDNTSLRKVIVLGPTVVSDLFPDGSNPLGKTVRIQGVSFAVSGVTTSKGGTGFLNSDTMAYIPLNVAQKQILGQSYLNTISLEAKSADAMTQAQNEVGYLLLSRHKLSDPSKADFSILSQQDILNTASSTTGTFTTLLSGIAGISLLVGGIGIMNIMLVTVTERTREIGLRKALGAKRNLITMQFLIESIILTFTGGLIGILVGISLSFIFSKLTGSLFIISPISILVAFAVSAAIGVLFGWYPASRAANLQPIEALRYE